MSSQLKRWLTPPTFADEDQTHRAALLHYIGVGCIAISLLMVILVTPVSTEAPFEEISLAITAIVITLFLLGRARRGHVNNSSLLFIGLMWCLLTFSVFEFEGGLRGAVVIWYVIIILIAGLLLGSRMGIATALLSMITITFLWQLELHGLFIAVPDTASTMWAVYNTIFIMTAILLHLAVTNIRSALAQARQHQKRLERKSAQLAKTNAELESLLFAIGHDLQEPLRSVRNFGDLVEKRYQHQLDPKGQDYVRRMILGAERMHRLLHDCVMLSQLRQMEDRQCVPASLIVKNALTQLDLDCHVVTVASDLPDLFVNVHWATEALVQLLSNAVKYSDQTEIAHIEIVAFDDLEKSGLVVMDRGRGVPIDQAERIFQLFQRNVGREIEGTGAGLTLVRQIAQQHDGHAWVEPRVQGGSRFIITFAKTMGEP